ncbi:hypothetical protein [Haloarcula salinisoli]|uniref:Uncharacterized protein n=1 Tax=Haloarcula salinisoli TaxID=2487746 RepID=A0A8J8C9B4_9EURY|nr:hypothetical protein [Halomicroarcula salinisoli]MBX0305157.1 hypothetical protein [Halomicroarcula salinisoli]
MALDIRRALQAGYDGLTSTAGLNVFSVLLVSNVAYGAVSQSFRQRLLTQIVSGRPAIQSGVYFQAPFDVEWLALEFPLAVLVALTVAAVVAHEGVRFWAIQQFADIPAPTLRERGRVLVAVAGGVALFVYAVRQVLPLVLVSQGFQMGVQLSMVVSVAVAPVLLVTVYLRQELALTAAGSTETVRNSVARFREAPVPIFGLLLLLAMLGQLLLLPGAVVSRLVTVRVGTTPSLFLEALNRVLFGALSTFSVATITDAYLQVRDGAPDAD